MTDSENIQPSEPTIDTKPVGNASSWRALIILAVCALFISGIGLYRLQKKAPTGILRDTELFFGSTKPVRSGSRVSIPIHIRTGANTVSAAELIIRYNPKHLTNVTIEPGAFFSNPTLLAQSVDTDTGKAILTIGTLSPRRGEGEIASLHATTMATSPPSIPITFDPATQVAALGENKTVVKSTTDATILIAP